MNRVSLDMRVFGSSVERQFLESIVLDLTYQKRNVLAIPEPEASDSDIPGYIRDRPWYREQVYTALLGYVSSQVREHAESTADIRYLPPDWMPSGPGWRALGMYDPKNHTIYLANNLPPSQMRWVLAHEKAHARGIRDERIADMEADHEVGYTLRDAA